MNQKISRNSTAATRREGAFDAIKTGCIEHLPQLVHSRKEANWTMPKLGWCLLDEAVKARRYEAVRWLLDHGADPNSLFYDDRRVIPKKIMGEGYYFSPMGSAVQLRDANMLFLLVQAGGDLSLPAIVDNEGGFCVIRSVFDMIPHGSDLVPALTTLQDVSWLESYIAPINPRSSSRAL